MRTRLPLGRSLFFAAVLIFSMFALFPLRLAAEWLDLDRHGFAARETKGSLWQGSFTDAQFGRIPLGTLKARLRLLPLLVGRARIDVEGEGDKGLRGGLTATHSGFGIDDVSGQVAAGAAFAPLPLSTIELSDLSVRFEDGRCAHADGTVRARVSGDVASLPLASGLQGPARCEGGTLLLPLKSQSGLESLDIRISDDGRFTVELGVSPTNASLAERLAAAGFAPNGGRRTMRMEGRF